MSEKANVVERHVYFKDGMGHDGQAVREVCKLYEPAKVWYLFSSSIHFLSSMLLTESGGECCGHVFQWLGGRVRGELERTEAEEYV